MSSTTGSSQVGGGGGKVNGCCVFLQRFNFVSATVCFVGQADGLVKWQERGALSLFFWVVSSAVLMLDERWSLSWTPGILRM